MDHISAYGAEPETHCPTCGTFHRQHGICKSCGRHTDWKWHGGFGLGTFRRRCEQCGGPHAKERSNLARPSE